VEGHRGHQDGDCHCIIEAGATGAIEWGHPLTSYEPARRTLGAKFAVAVTFSNYETTLRKKAKWLRYVTEAKEWGRESVEQCSRRPQSYFPTHHLNTSMPRCGERTLRVNKFD
jgi:hypothetical protein